MSSRFWSQGDSDSEEDSDTGYVVVPSPTNVRNRYLPENEIDSDDSIVHEHVVRSAKDKCFKEMSATISDMKNSKKINDWVNLQECFEKINKQLEKVLRATEVKKVPYLYVKAIVMFEGFIKETLADSDFKKKMSSSNFKTFNSLRRRLKRNNQPYEDLINKFSRTIMYEEEDEDEDEDSLRQDSAEEGVGERDNKRLTKNQSRIIWETVDQKLKEIIAAKERNSTGSSEQVEQLFSLIKIANAPAQKVEILFHILSIQLDDNLGVSVDVLLNVWRNCVQNLFAILDILAKYPRIVVGKNVKPEANETQKAANYKGPVRVRGDLVGIFERLYSMFVGSLQCLDAHSREYAERLGDELQLLALAQNLQAHLEQTGNSKDAAKFALKQVELLYYKPAEVYDEMRKLAENTKLADELWDLCEVLDDGRAHTPEVVSRLPSLAKHGRKSMDTLLSVIYKYGDVGSKAHAMLYDIYHLAVMDDFIASRDMLLLSRLQDKKQYMGDSTKAIFYRTIRQLGLCAFRAGLIDEAHRYISELFGGRAKELPIQGVFEGWYHEKSLEQIPHYMNMNAQLLETIHLTCAMLLEAPNMALKRDAGKPCKVISKAVRRLLETSEREVLASPPQNLHDHVSVATRALSKGDYEKAFETICSLHIWKLMRNWESVLMMLKTKMKEAALRACLLSHSSSCESLDLDRLGRAFDLSDSEMWGVIDKMLATDEVHARLGSGCMVFYYVQHRSMQALSSQLAEKLSATAA